MRVYRTHHLSQDPLFELENVVIMYSKVQYLETYLFPPGFEYSLDKLSNPPLMSVLIQISPSLEDINLIEPRFEYLSLFEKVNL